MTACGGYATPVALHWVHFTTLAQADALCHCRVCGAWTSALSSRVALNASAHVMLWCRYTMQRIIDLHVGVQAALKVHNTGKALQLVNNDLSALYYDCIKDTLCVHHFFSPFPLFCSRVASGTATRA